MSVKLIGILGLLVMFVISVALNVFLLMGKGIQIDRSVTNHVHQEQYQQQAQLLVGPFGTKGTLRWEKLEILGPHGRYISVEQHLMSLSPEQSLFAKIHDNALYVPRIE